MATKKRNLHSAVGTVAFANVFTPRQRKDAKGNAKGDPKYGLILVFDRKTDISELEDEVERVAIEKFGSKAPDMLAKGKLNNPIRDASDYEEHGAPFTLPGATMVSFKTGDQPGVVDADGEPLMSKNDFYSGCKARVSYRVFPYDNESKGVGIALVNVQKMDGGERLSGNPSAEEDFGGGAKRRSKGDDEDTPRRSAKRRPSRDDDDGDDLL